jgi:hypothetical protein
MLSSSHAVLRGTASTPAASWKGAFITAGAVFMALIMTMLFAYYFGGAAATIERDAQVAYSKAQQLLRDAEAENRKVRPLPLSFLAKSESSREFKS